MKAFIMMKKRINQNLTQVISKINKDNDTIDMVQGIPPEFFEVSQDNRNSYEQFVTEILQPPSSYTGKSNPFHSCVEITQFCKYEGQMNPNTEKPEGLGKMVEDGDYYEGVFFDGKLNGPGRCLVNGDLYEGNFQMGKLEGQGIIRSLEGMEYQGEFKDGVKHGQGVEKWENGSKYEGQFVKGEKDVKGKFTWTEDGNSYDGELKNGNLHGWGKI